MTNASVLCLAGDGIGPEVMREARNVLAAADDKHALGLRLIEAPFGGAALDELGDPFPEQTRELADSAQATLLGAVGGPRWDQVAAELRPEKGLLALRSRLGLYANLRPARVFPQLLAASSLREEIAAGLDLLIVRELLGGLYFGEPRGVAAGDDGQRRAFNTAAYLESEIERVARVACKAAERRSGRLCSVDKSNVLEVGQLWREVVTQVADDYPKVSLQHMYVDNAAMQLVANPAQFDVIVTSNLFGDILSDLTGALCGSLGMLPSASLGAPGRGLYEPCHGSAPDLAGRGVANPLGMILSAALMLRHSFAAEEAARDVERAVEEALAQGVRTADLCARGERAATTAEVGQAVVEGLARG